jgi:hypothetical protein
MRQILVTGEVRTIVDKFKKDKVTLFAHEYQLEYDISRGKVDSVTVVDFDLKRGVKVGDVLSNISVRPEVDDYSGNVKFTIQFVGNKPDEIKKSAQAIKV